MTPAPPSPSSHRTQHAERNVRLDPQGIYGTRSARRQNQLRRRRQVQNLVLWGIGAVAIFALLRWAMQPRRIALSAGQTIELPFVPASAPLSLEPNALFFASQSGGLWRAGTAPFTAPRRLWNEAFAPAAPPLLTPKQIFWAGGAGRLVALNLQGKVQWHADLPSALVARPALFQSDGKALVVTGDDAGHVAAYDAKSGVLGWKKSLGGALGAGFGILGPQNGAGAGILVPLLSGIQSRGGLVCLDGKTGNLRWSFPDDARSHSAGIAAPTVLRNRVFWCNDEGAVVCLDGRTGSKIWKNFAAPLDAPLDAKTQNFVTLRGAPTLVEAASVVVVGGNDGVLRAFDLASGAPRWNQQLGGAVRFAAQKLKFEGRDALLATGETAATWILDAKDGSVLRRWTTPFRNSNGVASDAKNVYALDAAGHLQRAALQ